MKTIVIIDVCSDELSKFEFVRPIVDIVESLGHKTHTKSLFSLNELPQCDGVIICGTALKDFDYLKYYEKISCINSSLPVLGICAGAQLLGLFYGSSLQDEKTIGEYSISLSNDDYLTIENPIKAYCLYSKTVQLSNDLISLSQFSLVFRHFKYPHYGILFHVEVKTPEMIRMFLNLEL